MRQADVASQRFGAVDGDLKKDLQCMLEMNNSYVIIDQHLQSSLLLQSVMQSGAARGPSAEQ